MLTRTARANDIVFLTVGDTAVHQGLLDRLRTVADPQEAFDAVLLLHPPSEKSLSELVGDRARYLVPIVDLSGAQPAWSDFSHPVANEVALEEALSAIAPIMERLRALPDLSGSPDNLPLQILAMAYTRGAAIEARLDPHQADLVSYPLLRGVKNASSLLADLANASLLRPRFFQRLHLCGRCKSARVNAREECTGCRSSHLEEVSLVHHYQCGYQASEDEFNQSGALICPKCRRELRHYAVDYDRPGAVHRCRECAEVDSAPAVGFLCADCGHRQDAEVAETRDWFHFDLLPAAVDALGTGLLPYRSLQSVMTQHYGALAVSDFFATARALGRVAKRYERPLTGLKLTLSNLDEIRDRRGSSGLAAIFSRLGEIVSQVLREADLVTAVDGAMYILLPETAPERAEHVSSRIEARVQEAIAEPLRFSLTQFDESSIPELAAELS